VLGWLDDVPLFLLRLFCLLGFLLFHLRGVSREGATGRLEYVEAGPVAGYLGRFGTIAAVLL
jgi:hypothetical protein